MKRDLDRLMKKMKIDAIYAEGHADRDANLYYLLNGANIFAYYIKKRGSPAHVIHAPIEREVAEKTGHRLINVNSYDRQAILKKYRNTMKANAAFASMLLEDLKVRGRVMFCGNFGLGTGYEYLRNILRFSRKVDYYNGSDGGLLARARMTKDADELSQIKSVRDAVIRSFDAMLKTARACKPRNGYLITAKGRRLTVGDLRRVIRSELFARSAIDSAGLIVAQGRDGAVPHNSGQDHQAVRLGQPIVFDIFPQQIGGGYFFDFTRTVCFGPAARPLKDLYNTVSCAHDLALRSLRVGLRTRDIELKICEFFEKKGHRTFLSDPKTQVGYCHSLGHGIGLNIHEGPYFNLYTTNKDRIEPNMVFTIEPGLYYPDQGYGVRIEDVIYVNKQGKIVNLTKYPRRLVVPM